MGNPSAKYLIVWLSVVIGAISAMALINRLVDPLHLFNTESVSMSASGYLRETKPWQVIIRQPQTVLIGNSRNFYASDVRLLPGNENYNFSLRGAKFATLHVAFKHAAFHAPLKTAYIAVDSICDSSTNGNISHFSSTTTEYYKAIFSRYTYLLSVSTLLKSLASEEKQNHLLFNKYGQRTEYPFEDYGQTLRARVEEKERQKINLLLKFANRARGKGRCGTQELTSMLRFAHEHSINLVLFVNPQHVRYMEISYLANGSVMNQSLKRTIVEVNEMVAKEMDKEPFPIWDFLVVNEYTTELLVERKANAKYWWEPSHFTTELGNKMIETMAKERVDEALIGFQLTSQSLEQHLLHQRKLYQTWRRNRQSEIKQLTEKLTASGVPLFYQSHSGPSEEPE